MPEKQNFISDKDSVGIEDVGGRIKLIFDEHSVLVIDTENETKVRLSFYYNNN
jgi:hypothetical protein